MRMCQAFVLAVVLALSPLYGFAEEKKVSDVKELAGSWTGWVTTRDQGDERGSMTVMPDGSYKAATINGSTTEGQFYLQNGKLMYRSSRTTGAAKLTEDKGRTTLTQIPDDPNFRTGTGRYERVK